MWCMRILISLSCVWQRRHIYLYIHTGPLDGVCVIYIWKILLKWASKRVWKHTYIHTHRPMRIICINVHTTAPRAKPNKPLEKPSEAYVLAHIQSASQRLPRQTPYWSAILLTPLTQCRCCHRRLAYSIYTRILATSTHLPTTTTANDEC